MQSRGAESLRRHQTKPAYSLVIQKLSTGAGCQVSAEIALFRSAAGICIPAMHILVKSGLNTPEVACGHKLQHNGGA